MSKLFRRAAKLAVAALLLAPAAQAQVYPAKPITIVVPGPAGGPPDTLARIIGEAMRKSLGQPLVVENAGGAGGTIAVGRVVRAAPDGYTMSIGHVASHVFSSAVYAPPYDVAADLTPVALLTTTPTWLIAANSLPANDIAGLIAWLKGNPGKAFAGVVGHGSPAHLCGLNFQSQTGTRFDFVSYKGGVPLMQDLMAGQIRLACVEASNTREFVQSGKVKAFAVMALRRWRHAPDVPTIDEAGVPGLHVPFWHGFWVPKGTPSDIVATLNRATIAALNDPDLKQRLAGLGHEFPSPEQQTPDALGSIHAGEIKKWTPIIKAANIKPE